MERRQISSKWFDAVCTQKCFTPLDNPLQKGANLSSLPKAYYIQFLEGALEMGAWTFQY